MEERPVGKERRMVIKERPVKKKRAKKKKWGNLLKMMKKGDYCDRSIIYAFFCKKWHADVKFQEEAEFFKLTPEFLFRTFLASPEQKS